MNNYEVAKLFKNDEFNMNVIKIDYDKFIIEFSEETNDKDKILKLIEDVKNNKENNKLIIDEIYDYNSFLNKFNGFIC